MSVVAVQFSEHAGSAELQFAKGVVSYIMQQYASNWTSPHRIEFSNTLTLDILASVYDTALISKAIFETDFDYKARNLQDFITVVDKRLREWSSISYDHDNFLVFCATTSMSAVYMVRKGHEEAPEYAVLAVLCVLLSEKQKRERSTREPSSELNWKCLDAFCKKIGEEKEENEV
ncbi:hypothetical protein CDAR_278771 [Caerostris darwini]|uniref:Uncharacterized protein n=1 Tax=Caerostris darwini TaxID=1538125 RepID=A0AAV4WQB1_9ARAC|nr:hypothetical protein CDAR_278771 [Caerostris darwini]